MPPEPNNPTAQPAPQADPPPGGTPPDPEVEPELTPDERIAALEWQNGSLTAILSHVFPEAVVDTEWREKVALMNDGSFRYFGALTASAPAPAPDADPEPEPAPAPQQTPRQRMRNQPPPRAPIAARPAAKPAAAAEPDMDKMTHEERSKYWRDVVKPQTVRNR